MAGVNFKSNSHRIPVLRRRSRFRADLSKLRALQMNCIRIFSKSVFQKVFFKKIFSKRIFKGFLEKVFASYLQMYFKKIDVFSISDSPCFCFKRFSNFYT